MAGLRSPAADRTGLRSSGRLPHADGTRPGEQAGGEYGSWWITNAVAGIAIALPGGLVAARRPRNPLGWVLLA
jgi:hypothetical protein